MKRRELLKLAPIVATAVVVPAVLKAPTYTTHLQTVKNQIPEGWNKAVQPHTLYGGARGGGMSSAAQCRDTYITPRPEWKPLKRVTLLRDKATGMYSIKKSDWDV